MKDYGTEEGSNDASRNESSANIDSEEEQLKLVLAMSQQQLTEEEERRKQEEEELERVLQLSLTEK